MPLFSSTTTSQLAQYYNAMFAPLPSHWPTFDKFFIYAVALLHVVVSLAAIARLVLRYIQDTIRRRIASESKSAISASFALLSALKQREADEDPRCRRTKAAMGIALATMW